MRSVFLVCAVWCMACGSDPTPGPGPADGGHAGVDAAGDRPTGLTPRCLSTGSLDCDGNGDCETRRNDPNNCGVCGRRCPAPMWCTSLGDCL